FTADEIETKCDINFENGAITESHLTVRAKIPEISEEKFQASAKEAKENCPISKLLNTNITMEASLG
ncbi:MAG TPA: OsmC family protein, partial [Chitinophagaceae bacterium]|nr:OsmC family protein [Chitinophagaceae bacterium]